MYGKITHLTPPVLFHQGVELGRVQIRNHIGTDMHELHLVQKIIDIHSISYLNRHVAGIDDLCSALVLVTRSGRHHEHRAYSAVSQTFNYSITSSSKTAGTMWREFPSEHQHSHYRSSLYLLIRLSMYRSAAVLIAEEMAPCGS